MRWKLPEKGDLKLVKRFLWLPEKFEKESIWLETVYYVYQFYGSYWDEEFKIPKKDITKEKIAEMMTSSSKCERWLANKIGNKYKGKK